MDDENGDASDLGVEVVACFLNKRFLEDSVLVKKGPTLDPIGRSRFTDKMYITFLASQVHPLPPNSHHSTNWYDTHILATGCHNINTKSKPCATESAQTICSESSRLIPDIVIPN